MSNSVYDLVEQSCRTLRLDLSSLEFAKLAEEYDFKETQLQAICQVLEHSLLSRDFFLRFGVPQSLHPYYRKSGIPRNGIPL